MTENNVTENKTKWKKKTPNTRKKIMKKTVKEITQQTKDKTI